MPEDMLETFSPMVRLLCEQLLACPGVTAGVAVAAQVSLTVHLHPLDAPGTPAVGEMVLMFSASCFLYYMDERQHNPQLVSA